MRLGQGAFQVAGDIVGVENRFAHPSPQPGVAP